MSPLARVSGTLQRLDDRLRRALGPTELDRRLEAQYAPVEADPALVELVRRAWAVGSQIDLSGIAYGPSHSKSGSTEVEPSSYYYFLAGLVRLKGFRRILEFGTYQGGSIRAILRGAENLATPLKVVTVDAVDHGKTPPSVEAIIGEANSEAVVQRVLLAFDADPIDFLFIDADHRFIPTLATFGIFASLLKPRYVCLDDILLSKSMRALWTALSVTHRENAVNCVEIEPAIRPRSCGFGLIRSHEESLFVRSR